MAWGEWYDSGISVVLALVLVVMGGIPLFNTLGWTALSLGPLESLFGQIFLYVCALGGLWLLFDALWGKESEALKWVGILVGIVVLALGAIPLLNQYGVIAWTLPVLSMMVYQVLFVLEAIILVFSAFHQ